MTVQSAALVYLADIAASIYYGRHDRGDIAHHLQAFIMALLDHILRDNEYDNALFGGLAVLSIQKDGIWILPRFFTQLLAAVIKIA